MRICIDLDGVVCQLRREGQSYADLEPVPGAVAKLRALKAAGHYLILFTARHMKTCGANVGLVIARQGKATLDWLDRHQIAYDEIHFGKPHADVYLDDNAVRFVTWEAIAADGSNLPASSESARAGVAVATGGGKIKDPDKEREQGPADAPDPRQVEGDGPKNAPREGQ